MIETQYPVNYLKQEKVNSENFDNPDVNSSKQTQEYYEHKRYRRFDSDDERNKNRELFSAIRNNDLQKVEDLLKAGVKCNIIDKHNKNNTPLHYAVERDKKEIVQALLQEKSVDIDAKNIFGNTPLHIAVSKDYQELVKLLLDHKAKPNIMNNANKTPLNLAKEVDNTNPNKEIIIQMLDKIVDLEDNIKHEQTLSHPDKNIELDINDISTFVEKTIYQQYFQVWLMQEDIANIARAHYGWYGDDNEVIFEVIGSIYQLGKQLTTENIEKLRSSIKQSLTFIVNLNNLHWVTLVITYQKQKFSAYYVDSFAEKIPKKYHNELEECMKGIIVIEPITHEQQDDKHNCGIYALENAKIINDKIKAGQTTNEEIKQALKNYKPTSNELMRMRTLFAEKLQKLQKTAETPINVKAINDISTFVEKTIYQQDFKVCLMQEDIANIARTNYGWYGDDSKVIFEVIGSIDELGKQSTNENIEKLRSLKKQSLTFIINPDKLHWETLVITYKKEKFSAYYADPVAKAISRKIRNKLKEFIKGIIVIKAITNKQQVDEENYGIYALENAKIINDKIKAGQTNKEIKQALENYKLTSDQLKLMRKMFAEQLQKQQNAKVIENESKDSKLSLVKTPNSEKISIAYNDSEQKILSSKKYHKSGLVNFLHGNIYQLKLLMLFVKRAHDKGYIFELATEMDKAEKFDDVVFRYKKKESDKWKGRFLQAKHKQVEGESITINDLLTPKTGGEFSLQKYFISYRKIKEDREFTDQLNKDFVICTNIGFKFGEKKNNLELSGDIFNKETDESGILNSELLQFKKEFSGREEIVSVLNDAPDFNKLAKVLAECVLEDKSINNDKSENSLDENVFISYQYALINKVIVKKKKHKLSNEFINGKDLPPEIQNLRNAFRKQFDDKRKSFNLDDDPKIGDEKIEPLVKDIVDLIKNPIRGAVKGLVKIEKGRKSIKENFDKLAGHVLVKKNGNTIFSTAFLNKNKDLPGDLNKFRKIFLEKVSKNYLDTPLNELIFIVYPDFKACPEIYVDEKNFWENIKEAELELFPNFGVQDNNIKSVDTFVEKFVSMLKEEESQGNNIIPIKRDNSIISKNIDKLSHYALIEKNDEIKFTQTFWNIEEPKLPGNLNKFRTQLEAKIKEFSIEKSTLENFKFVINNFPKFELPNDSTNQIKEHIEEFLNDLKFAVNEPNEVQLGETIKMELGKEFKAYDINNVYARFLEKILDWMKDKEGKYFTDKEGKDFFEEIKKEILKNSIGPFLLAQEKLNEAYDERKRILGENNSDSGKFQMPIENFRTKGEDAQSQNCISSSTASRRKREAASEKCLFTWEDIDEFNDENKEKRDINKINIDSGKFISYIKDLPEEAKSQLIEFAAQSQVTGNAQGQMNKLISHKKISSHLDRVGKISRLAMDGMMAKNVLADFLNGDYEGVAINIGFIAGGKGLAKVAEAASFKGLKLIADNKLLLGSSLKVASSFLARGTSAFVVYDLVNQIKEYRNGSDDALVDIVGDSIYLGVDSAEIGVELAETFGLLEGVSSVTGPIGAAIGAVIFVGTDVYKAMNKVNKIDQLIHLTRKEKFVEGLRAFIGIKPRQYIEDLVEEKQLYNQQVKQGLEYLKLHHDIQNYVFPTSDRKFEFNSDSKILLDQKKSDVKWSRSRPDDVKDAKLFCLPHGNHETPPGYGLYLCENAIGISKNEIGNYTLINLADGKDYAKGFSNSSNIFVVNNGYKEYYGGNTNDLFVLTGNFTGGYLYGEGGIDTLDLTQFARNSSSLDIFLDATIENGDSSLKIAEMERILGRKDKSERIYTACGTMFLDGQGGAENSSDTVVIRNGVENNICIYNTKIVVRSRTNINNQAFNGEFDYLVLPSKGEAVVNITSLLDGVASDRHNFFFNSTISELLGISIQSESQIYDYNGRSITFSFLSTDSKTEGVFDSQLNEKTFNLIVSDIPVNASYTLSNGAQIKIGSKDNSYILEKTLQPVEDVLKDYLPLANRVTNMSFFIQSYLTNETIVIGSGNYEVIHNNPMFKSHLVGNGGENIYVIDSETENTPEIIIHDVDEEKSIDTIDLRNLVRKITGKFEVQIVQSQNNLRLSLIEENLLNGLLTKSNKCTLILKDGVKRYNKTHIIIENVPMVVHTEGNRWNLRPQPLIFEKNEEIIVITSDDVEEGNEIVTPRKGGNYKFLRGNDDDLIITNALDMSNDLCSITLSKFYKTPKMKTLLIKFADLEISLTDRMEEINKAKDINFAKKEYSDQVYAEVFDRDPEVIMISDQPETQKQSPSRQKREAYQGINNNYEPIMWINNLFGWFRDSTSEFLSSKPDETFSTESSISPTDISIDVNGTIMLIDMLIRKVTGQKYISSVENSISLLEAQSHSLNIIEEFKKIIEKVALRSGISLHRLHIDFLAAQKEVTDKILSGKWQDISKVLSTIVDKACPGTETGYPGRLSPKKLHYFKDQFLKELDIFLNQSIKQIVNDGGKVNKITKSQEINSGSESFLKNTTIKNRVTWNETLRL